MPHNYRIYVVVLSPINGEPGAIPNLWEGFLNSFGNFTVKPFNQNYELMDFNSRLFILNSGRKLLLWGVLLFSYPIVKLASAIFGAMKHKPCKLWAKLEVRYKYQFIIRALAQSYVSMVLTALLNVYTHFILQSIQS